MTTKTTASAAKARKTGFTLTVQKWVAAFTNTVRLAKGTVVWAICVGLTFPTQTGQSVACCSVSAFFIGTTTATVSSLVAHRLGL